MASIDELFRRPNAAQKRKHEDPTQSFSRSQPSKAAKHANDSSPRTTTSNGQPPPPSVEDDDVAAPIAEDDEDIEAGPTLPPDEEAEDEGGDDEDGRFFGSGVTDGERQAMNLLNKNDDAAADDAAEETIDLPWLKRTAISFERKINKNAELRAKYADDPLKFVSSEADLDSEIKTLSLLAEYPNLYKDFVKSGSLNSLVGLLAHENTDIAIAAVQVLEELTDEDTSALADQWTTLTAALFDADILDLLVSNLSRLESGSSSNANANDRDGIYHILSVFENLLSSPTNHDRIGSNGDLLTYLLTLIKTADPSSRQGVSQNRQYAAELFAIILSQSHKTRTKVSKTTLNDADSVDTILQLLAPYRNHDPEPNSEEEEFIENLFDCITCLVEDQGPCEKFLDAEGIELCLIMLREREGKLSKARSLRILDHAMAGANAMSVCDRVIEAAGLKTLFGLLSKLKANDKTSKKKPAAGLERESTEHLIGILSSLLRYTPADTPARIRTLAKFVEKEYEKLLILVNLRAEYAQRLARIDAQIEKESAQGAKTGDPVDEDEAAEQEDEYLSRRLDAGLFSLQTLDVVLSWLAAEDRGARAKIEEQQNLNGNHISGEESSNGQRVDGSLLAMLKTSLTEQLQGMNADTEKAKEGREMLEALITCL